MGRLVALVNTVHNLSDQARHAIDWGAVAVVLATLASILPGIAAFLSVVWFGIRIYVGLLEAKKERLEIKKLERFLNGE